MLPRLIVAAILVNVSFYICQIAVDLSNILGFSLKGGLTSIGSALNQANGYLASGSVGDVWGGLATTILAAPVAAGAVTIGLPALLAGVVSSLIALVVVSLLLIARKALIIVLIVVSPLAFVAFLLPNTEQWFKKWYKMFIGLLLVFPVVGLLFGGGVLAGEIIRKGADGNIVLQVVAETVKVIPLFAVWGLLKKSMDVAGNIGAKINQMGGSGIGKTLAQKARTRGEKSYFPARWNIRKQQKDRDRALAHAGMSNKGGIRQGVSRWAFGGLNRIGGDSGNVMRARGIHMAEKEEREQIEQEAMFLRAESEDPAQWNTRAEGALHDAMASGNVRTARAAASILMSGGSDGIDRLHNQILAGEADNTLDRDSAVSVGLRRDITNAGMAGKDRGLEVWSHDHHHRTLAQVDADRETFVGLTPEQLAGQTAAGLGRAVATNAVTPEMARQTLDNHEASSALNARKMQILNNIAAPAAANPVPAATVATVDHEALTDSFREALQDALASSNGVGGGAPAQAPPPQTPRATTNFEGQSYEQRDSGLFTPRRK